MQTRVRPIAALLLSAMLAPSAELPVRSVILYKHGVGFFERSGTLGPGDTAQLDFKADEMNDVLKSLTINDAGGNVKGLRYDSSIPLEEKLNEFPFRIANGQPLSAVIDQLKGARLEMEFGPQKIAGAIVSARMVPGDKERGEHEQLTLLMDSGELRNVDLAAATMLKFTDSKLQLQFRDYLMALTGARSKDKRSVYIDSKDSKSREVRATYIIPMPAWKSSYRLLLDAAGSSLEGWAVVDNTTGEDWTNVKISLVSGKPISFISQLYEPKFILRKSADLPEDEAVAPTIHGGAVRDAVAQDKDAVPIERKEQFAKLQNAPAAAGMSMGAIGSGRGGGMGAGVFRVDGASMSSVRELTTATEIADLFEYSIRNAITVKKNESAMLPFLQQKINSRKLLIYSDPTKANPLNAAELTNNTGKTLDGGPITVYDGGAYAGEALVETVKAGDKRFISYGVDLGTRIATTLDSRTDATREVHVRNGLLVTRSALIEKKTYSVRNVDARAKTLILEHPVRTPYKLIDSGKPSETTKDVYRFEVKIPANGQLDVPITEENVFDNSTMISNITADVLLIYVRNKNLTDSGRRQLQAIVDIKQQIANIDGEKRKLDGDVTNTTNDEQRLRQNIQSLSGVSGQQQTVQDYARKLAENESTITKTRDRQVQLDQQHTALQTQLNDMIQRLDF